LGRRGGLQIVLVNRRRGGAAGVALRALLLLLLWAPLPLGMIAAWRLGSLLPTLPPTPDVRAPLGGEASEIFATDGSRVGGLLRGRRPRVAYEDLSPRVRFAFLAAEDDAFFAHDGFDLVAIARAWLRNRAAGRVVEGGSTISQQLAKRHLTNHKTYERKLVELFLARRIEARWSKGELLEAYLNEVYLGAGAVGVQAAAEIYFDKALDELTWPEAALLAAVTSSPSQLSPYRNPKKALEKRRLILLRLARLGVMREDEAEALALEPLRLRQRWDGDEDTVPYAAVEVRELLKARYGPQAMEQGGFTATQSVSPVLQEPARRALARGLGRLDRRQGYRGPLVALPEALWGELDRAVVAVYGLGEGWAPVEGRPYVARVVEARERSLRVQLGDRALEIAYEGAGWASPWERGAKRNEVLLEDLRAGFAAGDVILVAWDRWPHWDAPPGARRGQEPREVEGWRVDQAPKVEGVLLSNEVDTGYARAVVGGWDFDRSEYNRALRACRQPGSVFKPIVYARALEDGLTPATVLSDTPIKIEKTGGEIWAPKNADNDFSGFLLLRDALARSRNLPSVEVFRHIGAANAAEMAYRLGITTPMAETEALSLGASCVKPWDLARVYGTFARRGVKMEPRLLLTVRRGDEILEDHGHFADPSEGTAARLDRIVRAAWEPPGRALDETHAYMMLQMLRAVVYAGTGYGATALGVPVAGKTGTTNAYDTWFVGFTESLLTTVWVGADGNERPVGSAESGGRVALPIWLEFMQVALKDRPQGGVIGEVPEGIEIRRVDRALGLLSEEGEPGIDLPFVEGTAPTELAPTRKARDVERVDRLSSEF
jgi:penicillin-binding protein 1A